MRRESARYRLLLLPGKSFQQIADKLSNERFDRFIASPANGQGIEHLEAGEREQHIDKLSLVLTRSHPADEHRQGLAPSLRSLLQALRDLVVQLGHSGDLGENLPVRRPKSAEHRDEAKQSFGNVRLRKHRWESTRPFQYESIADTNVQSPRTPTSDVIAASHPVQLGDPQ